MASKIAILRRVATAVGARPPTDENESTAFLRQILPHWDGVVDDFTTRHAWTWGTQTRDITATADTPPPPWVYSYALPVDRTLIRDLTDSSGAQVDYDIENGRVLCNHPGPLNLKINVAATPGGWPGDFAMCVQRMLEGHSWSGFRDEPAKGEGIMNTVERRLIAVIARDKRQKPPGRHMRGTVFQAFRGTLNRRRTLDG